jgi:hypothetical protein
MMLRVLVYSLAATLGLFCNASLAEKGAYQIELIVFTQTMPNTELFKQTASQINWPSDLTELSAYKIPEMTSLDVSYSALSKDSTYKPILHVAWIQSTEMTPVHIQSPDGKLNGYVQVQSGQLKVDLELSSSPGEIIYRLTEKRSIKLNEIYYLDHPKFGLVVKISPV